MIGLLFCVLGKNQDNFRVEKLYINTETFSFYFFLGKVISERIGIRGLTDGHCRYNPIPNLPTNPIDSYRQLTDKKCRYNQFPTLRPTALQTARDSRVNCRVAAVENSQNQSDSNEYTACCYSLRIDPVSQRTTLWYYLQYLVQNVQRTYVNNNYRPKYHLCLTNLGYFYSIFFSMLQTRAGAR